MRLCCELCQNVQTHTFKQWLDHLTSSGHQELTQEHVWSWDEERNLRSLVVSGRPNERGEFGELQLTLGAISWHFSQYGIISDAFLHPSLKFGIVQLEKREQAHRALNYDTCFIDGIGIFLRPKTDLSVEDWFNLSSRPISDDTITRDATKKPINVLQAKHSWYSEKMKDLDPDLQLAKFITLATMCASDFQKREKIRSDLSLLIKREYSNAKIQGMGDVITGLGDSESALTVYVDVLGPTRLLPHYQHYSTTHFVQSVYRMMLASSASSNRFCTDVIIAHEDSQPHIKLTHHPTTVTVDLHFESSIRVYTSKLIQFMISLDPRVLPLMLMVRYWATLNVHPTNSFSDYVLELLVVTFLNSCKILPNFAFLQSKSTSNIPLVDNFWNVNFCSNYQEITEILSYSGKAPVELSHVTNKPTAKSIMLLARNFFQMYATADLKNNVLCSLLGNLIPRKDFSISNPNDALPCLLQPYKNWALVQKTELNIYSPMCIQDPFNLGKNLAADVTEATLAIFQQACESSIAIFEQLAEDADDKCLSNFMDFATMKITTNFDDYYHQEFRGKPGSSSSGKGTLGKGPLKKPLLASATVTSFPGLIDIESDESEDDIEIVDFVVHSSHKKRSVDANSNVHGDRKPMPENHNVYRSPPRAQPNISRLAADDAPIRILRNPENTDFQNIFENSQRIHNSMPMRPPAREMPTRILRDYCPPGILGNPPANSSAKYHAGSQKAKRAKRRRHSRNDEYRELAEAVPADGVETYELRTRHIVQPNFIYGFTFLFKNIAERQEIELRGTTLWVRFFKDFFTEVWETAFKLSAEVCDSTIILSKLYENRSNLDIQEFYARDELLKNHISVERKHNTHRFGGVEHDEDDGTKNLVRPISTKVPRGYFRDYHPYLAKFAQLNPHEKFCISFLVGGCTNIFTEYELRAAAIRETNGLLVGNITPLEKEGMLNRKILQKLERSNRGLFNKMYKEFVATIKVDMTKQPPELLTIFTEIPNCPGMKEVFYNMADNMKKILTQHQNYCFERWLED